MLGIPYPLWLIFTVDWKFCNLFLRSFDGPTSEGWVSGNICSMVIWKKLAINQYKSVQYCPEMILPRHFFVFWPGLYSQSIPSLSFSFPSGIPPQSKPCPGQKSFSFFLPSRPPLKYRRHWRAMSHKEEEARYLRYFHIIYGIPIW